MASPYAKTVGGKLRLKGNVAILYIYKHERLEQPLNFVCDLYRSKKRKRTRKSERVESKVEDNNPQTDQPTAEDVLTKCKGTGRILSSGTTLMGQIGTKFLQELSVGDAIIIQHPTSLMEETRILRMVLSDVSASLSSPFSTDLISSTSFSYIKAPKDEDEQENASTLKKRILKSDEKNAFGTYAGGTEMGTELTYRVKKSGVYGGYQLIREKASAVRTREELLDFREKKKGDRHCM
uniref:Uncharacterized protein AlNc14C150G7504 n=1 Tax=Albugo laibachii Nc14 TaxID=890382 RepID=F0WLZ1_9STRA|nr:conserved unknown protein putative [Albugo laibachii Nc14]|eukprot:CCA22318.1 conserved unknown protein putative [Albugo laibachii Nc14]